MNTCNNFPLYLYKEMNEAEVREFEKHLKTCKECQDNLKFFNAVKDRTSLKNASAETLDAIFEKTSRKKPFWSFLRTFQVGFAAICLLVGVFFFADFNSPVHNNDFFDAELNSTYSDLVSISSDLDEYESIFKA